jgi:alpha-mannosidase
MGVVATAFARLPGIWIDNPDNQTAPDGSRLQAVTLFGDRQIDFVWSGGDGSTVLAHWMPSWYGSAGPDELKCPTTLQTYLEKSLGSGTQDVLTVSPTRYVYVPLANDFQAPIETLASTCRDWNQSPRTIDGATVYCASGTYDDFVQLAGSVAGQLATLGATGGKPLYTTPYMAGAYASRPLLKILHQRGVRALLAAETFAVIAATSGAAVASDAAATQAKSPSQSLLDAWNLLAPSTHHDFITGTAHPNVYRSEQLPLLRTAVSTAEWLREDAMVGVAAMLAPPAPNASVAVFNQLGFARTVLAECDPNAIGGATEVVCGGVTGPVQESAEGGSLFLAAVPALGYATASPTSRPPTSAPDVVQAVPEPATNPAQIVLENGQLRVILTEASGWGVAAVYDKAAARDVIPSGSIANEIAIFRDAGTEYALGCENGGTFSDSGVQLVPESVEILESGPLRGRVRVTSTCQGPDEVSGTLTFVREYTLVSGEAMLRMELTGRAPLAIDPATDQQCSTTVMAKLPLSGTIDGLVRGTPTHWTSQMPQLVWEEFTPYAPHHFAVAYDGTTALGAILHADVPACGLMWSLSGSSWSNDGVLYAALLRNTTGSYYGWTRPTPSFPGGTDYDVHTRRFALLVPSACAPADTGVPLQAGMHFATPSTVSGLNQYLVRDTPAQPLDYSLAQVSGPAILTAAKLGTVDPAELVLRLYQPTNASLPEVKLTFDPAAVPGWSEGCTITARLVTALEEPIAEAGELTVAGSTITLDMEKSIATVSLSIAS